MTDELTPVTSSSSISTRFIIRWWIETGRCCPSLTKPGSAFPETWRLTESRKKAVIIAGLQDGYHQRASCGVEVGANSALNILPRLFALSATSTFINPIVIFFLFHTSGYIKVCHLIPINMARGRAKSNIKNNRRQPPESKDPGEVFRVRTSTV